MWLVAIGLAPTEVVDVAAGRIEYRLDPRGDRTVVVLHAADARAALAFGEEPFSGRTLTRAGVGGVSGVPCRRSWTVNGR
jgi:hypothetical protein